MNRSALGKAARTRIVPDARPPRTALTSAADRSGDHADVGGRQVEDPQPQPIPDGQRQAAPQVERRTMHQTHGETRLALQAAARGVDREPDHLDRHGSFEQYLAAKKRIFQNQVSSDFAILNADDEQSARMAGAVVGCFTDDAILLRALGDRVAVMAREVEIHAGAEFFRTDQGLHHAHDLLLARESEAEGPGPLQP